MPFLHVLNFPHYTNQGSRPSGAMRDGDWMLVEYYDEPEAELYALGSEVCAAPGFYAPTDAPPLEAGLSGTGTGQEASPR